ncbi:IS66-like element accessory protein TnpA [Teichococcus deserti]|uniref:IS66-like element accessory protein TnpA n=1 Tax=Teichococcus deserti TaxID=1817963 RepID=UPI000977EF7A|nr:transposase [Pseudoroseomonas deserti]
MTLSEDRRSYTPEEKVRLVAETLRPGASVQGVSRRHGVCSSLLHRWRRDARAAARGPGGAMPRVLPVRLMTPEVAEAAEASGNAADGGAPPIEIVLRNGRVLRASPATDPAVLARLALALEA